MPKNWTSEASTLGLPPGSWPSHIEFTPPGGYSTRTMTRGAAERDADNDVTFVFYHDAHGNSLKVFND